MKAGTHEKLAPLAISLKMARPTIHPTMPPIEGEPDLDEKEIKVRTSRQRQRGKETGHLQYEATCRNRWRELPDQFQGQEYCCTPIVERNISNLAVG